MSCARQAPERRARRRATAQRHPRGPRASICRSSGGRRQPAGLLTTFSTYQDRGRQDDLRVCTSPPTLQPPRHRPFEAQASPMCWSSSPHRGEIARRGQGDPLRSAGAAQPSVPRGQVHRRRRRAYTVASSGWRRIAGVSFSVRDSGAGISPEDLDLRSALHPGRRCLNTSFRGPGWV